MEMEALRTFVNRLLPVSEPDFALLASIATVRALPKGAYLLEPGQVGGQLFFACQGLLRMYYVDAEGHEMNYRFATAPTFFVDFQSFITQQPSRYYWQALSAAEIYCFPYAEVQRLYQQSPTWDRFGRLMAERVYQQVNERVELLQFLTPEQRYQYVQQRQPELLEQISQAQLASYLGVQPESLSRIRKRLSQQ